MSENMIDELIFIHRRLGIQCTKWENSNNGSFVVNITNNKHNIKKFAELINFEFSLITKGKSKGKLKRELLEIKLAKYAKRKK